MMQPLLRFSPYLLLFCLGSSMGCDDAKPPPESKAPGAVAAPGNAPPDDVQAGKAKKSAPGATNDQAIAKGSTSKSAPNAAEQDGAGKSGVTGAACLTGRWHYDFADDALETMIANLPQGKVTKEEGELICESTVKDKEGTWTCSSAGGKPVIIEISANQSGMPLAINMKMSGKTTSKFKLSDEKTMAFTSSGIGDLKVDVEATIAGNKIPFPGAPMLQALSGDLGGTNSYECSGDELRLRTHIDGNTSWQKLRRLK